MDPPASPSQWEVRLTNFTMSFSPWFPHHGQSVSNLLSPSWLVLNTSHPSTCFTKYSVASPWWQYSSSLLCVCTTTTFPRSLSCCGCTVPTCVGPSWLNYYSGSRVQRQNTHWNKTWPKWAERTYPAANLTYDNTRRNLKQRWGILATENLLTTIVTCQFLVNTVFPYSGLLQL